MRFDWRQALAMVVVVASGALMLPRIFQAEINSGQIAKQTFSVEMAKSYQLGDTVVGFPVRHFAEVYHPGPVPWAEEFPLYTWGAAKLSSVFGVRLVVFGRMVSFLAFLMLLLAAARLGEVLDLLPDRLSPWVFAAVAASFPAFRIYGVSFMPDLCMTAACAWMLNFAARERWRKALAAGLVACLFKYYAVFMVAGVVAYRAWRDRRVVRPLAWGAAAVFPSLVYLAWFLSKGVPNPITEYRYWTGGGHVGISLFSNLEWYSKLVTWNLVKNPTVLGGALAILGMVLFFRRSSGGLLDAAAALDPQNLRTPLWQRWFLGTQLIFGFLFMVVFGRTFIIHDYYGLQWAVLFALSGAWTVMWLFRERRAAGRVVGAVVLATLAALGFSRTQAATMPTGLYHMAALTLTSNTEPGEMGVIVSSAAGEALSEQAARAAWVVHVKDWDEALAPSAAPSAARLRPYFERDLTNSRAKWVALLLNGPNVARFDELRGRLAPYGWTKIIGQGRSFPENRKDQSGRVWIFRR